MTELAYPNPELQSGSLVLRRWCESDIPLISRTWSDPNFGPFITGASDTYSEEEARDWLAGREGRQLSGSLELAVAHEDFKEPIGSVSAEINTYWLRAEIGYWLTPAAEGQGFMTTAVGLLCEWLFNTLNLGRIELITSPANIASQRVAQRVGFREEGLLRAYLLDHKTRVRRDSQIWSLLPADLTTNSPT